MCKKNQATTKAETINEGNYNLSIFFFTFFEQGLHFVSVVLCILVLLSRYRDKKLHL